MLTTILATTLLFQAKTPVKTVKAPPAVSRGTFMLISWDGAPDWVVDRLLSEGKLPNVQRLVKSGVRFEAVTPAWPSKTAVGHAAIFTGAWGDVNGVSGNSVPLLPHSEHTILETRSGFDSRNLKVDPIYIAAAKQGKRVVVLSATQAHPAAPHQENLKKAGVPADRYVQWSGFESRIADGQMLDLKDAKVEPTDDELPIRAATVKLLKFKVGETDFFAAAYDDPNDPVVGYDTVALRRVGSERTFSIKPSGSRPDLSAWSPPMRASKGNLIGNTFFRLFSLQPDGSRMELYQRAVNGLVGAATELESADYLRSYGGFHDDPFGLYEDGAFGPTLADGGTGEAEGRVLELVRLDCQFLKNGVRYALGRYKPDLLFHYTPMSDSAGHTWMGVLDPESSAYKPDLAAKIWPYYEQVFQLQDDWLGFCLDQLGPRGTVALVSDHGMAGYGRTFYVNAALAQAGLLQYDAQGRVDLSKTKAYAPSWSGNCIVVNSTDWKNGIVAPGDKAEVLAQARKALLSVTNAAGERVVTAVFAPDEVLSMGVNSSSSGDLFFDLAPDYSLDGRRSNSVLGTEAVPWGAGEHGYWPLRRKMQAIGFIGGSGVRPGVSLPLIRQIDLAPTIFDLLGLKPLTSFRGLVAPVRK
ncbi:MAG: alkaline phosphatase family protein [Fimbriimonas sp.]